MFSKGTHWGHEHTYIYMPQLGSEILYKVIQYVTCNWPFLIPRSINANAYWRVYKYLPSLDIILLPGTRILVGTGKTKYR